MWLLLWLLLLLLRPEVLALSFPLERFPVSLPFPAVIGTGAGPGLSLRVGRAAPGAVAAGVLSVCKDKRGTSKGGVNSGHAYASMCG